MQKKYELREDFDLENRFQLKDVIGKYTISTVDLGFDHNFFGDRPIYYETMIFEKGKWQELYCERYFTKEEAMKGHLKAMKWVKKTI